MKRFSWILFAALFSLVPVFGLAQADDAELEAVPEADAVPEKTERPRHLRISAIAGSGENYYVGMVNQISGEARMLTVGNEFGGYEVVDIMPEEYAVQIKRGDEEYILFLEGDETLIAEIPKVMDEGEGWSEDIELPPTYKTREAFLREQAERLGMIEVGAPLPSEWVEPVTPEEALRRMAESVGMEVPEDALKPRSREDFLREFAPAEPLAD